MAGFEIVKKDDKNGLNNIFQPVAVWLLLLAVFVAIDSVFKFDISNMAVAIVIATATAAGYYVQIICNNVKKTGLLILGIIAFSFFVLYFLKQNIQTMFLRGIQPFYNGFVEKYKEYYGTEFLMIEENESAMYPLVILFILMFILGIITSYIMRKKKGIIVVSILALAPVMLDSFVGYLPGTLSCWLLFSSFILFFQCYRNKDNSLCVKEFVTTCIALVALLIVGAMVQPMMKDYVEENEEDYLAIREKIVKLQSMEHITIIQTENKSNYAEGGIGEGNLSDVSRFMPSGKDKLEVTLSEKPDEDVYIKAYVGSVYEDEKWRGLYSIVYEYIFDSIYDTDDEYQLMKEPYDRIRYGTTEVSPVNMFINKLEADDNGYIPYYALPSDPDLVHQDAYVNSNGEKDSSYSFYFRSDAEQLGSNQLYEASDLWSDYRIFVYNNYLDNPDNLDQLEALCDSMNVSTVQDVENAIDTYFEENLTYSVAPGKVPAGKDFVEYFLFENRRGFCVHFASTATLMYRYFGCPSRYVEGYYIPKDKFTKQENGTYKAVVEDRMAHSWCEVYDEDLGWQVKEHTLGYDGSINLNNQNIENPTNTSSNNQQETTSGSNEESTTATSEQQETTSAGSVKEEKTTTAGIGIGRGEKGKSLGEVVRDNYIVIIIITVVLIIELQRRVRYKLRILKFGRIKDNLGVAGIYSAICDICVFQGMKIKNKTDRDILKIMMHQFEQLTHDEWKWIYELAERSAFSEEMVYSDDREKMLKLYKYFRKQILFDMNWIKKVWFLYVLAM